MNEVIERSKILCEDKQHPVLYYDAQGLRLRCRHCKTNKLVSWEELQVMYQQMQATSTSERPVLY